MIFSTENYELFGITPLITPKITSNAPLTSSV